MKKRRILVTSALPYANGSIHLGHMVEHIQTDIWVRFQQLIGNECYYVCADDAHGTPIMLRAEKEGISAQALIDKTKQEHETDFKGFLINHHQYYSTHSPENKMYTEKVYQALDDKNYILRKVISQAFDTEKQIFLPDRFIKGICPHCKAKDQYGDNCEVCGATYTPNDLLEAYSVLSGSKPMQKESEHYFFDLPRFQSFLVNWLKEANLQQAMRNKIGEWFEAGLQPWDISRDAPYWGFQIPRAQDKYFYVWLDAPIGYMGSFKTLCDRLKIDFDDFWSENTDTELYHFIGKDIAYFHMLFWPAILEGAGYRKPTGVFCHGFLTVNGEKMSKSRGTFIKADTYLKHLRPEYLRYYFASKLSSSVEDIDLNLQDFQQKVNSDLVGKFINLASRCAPFLMKTSNNQLSASMSDSQLFDQGRVIATSIAEAYERRDYSQAIREAMKLADAANSYIDIQKPWVKIKDDLCKDEVQMIATVGLNAFMQLVIMLQPVLPQLAEDAKQFLNLQHLQWSDINQPLLDHKINGFKPMMQRIEEQSLQAIINDSKEDIQKEENLGKEMIENTKAEINIEDFDKLELRIAKVISCEQVEGADKLLKFKLDVGELGERQVFSGIKKFHSPEELQGQLVVYIANLKPRKMRFGMSEGMILSASDGEDLQILLEGGRAKAGMTIK